LSGLIGRVAGVRRDLTAQHSQIRQRISQGLILHTVAIRMRIQAALDGAVRPLNLFRQFDGIKFKQRRLIGISPVIFLIFVHEITSKNARPLSCGSLL
jgi:hypothetical protein